MPLIYKELPEDSIEIKEFITVRSVLNFELFYSPSKDQFLQRSKLGYIVRDPKGERQRISIRLDNGSYTQIVVNDLKRLIKG